MKDALLTLKFSTLKKALGKNTVKSLLENYLEKPTSNNLNRVAWELVYASESLPAENLVVELNICQKKGTYKKPTKADAKKLTVISGISKSELVKFQHKVIELREKLRDESKRFILPVDIDSPSKNRTSLITAYKRLSSIYANMGVTELSRNKDSFFDMMISFCMPTKDRPFSFNVFSENNLSDALNYLSQEYDKLTDPDAELTTFLIDYYLKSRDKDYKLMRESATSPEMYSKFMLSISMIKKTIAEFDSLDINTKQTYLKIWVDTQMEALDNSDLPDSLQVETGYLCREASIQRFDTAIRSAVKKRNVGKPTNTFQL